MAFPHVIIGLGNPEPRYDHTRHNIGFEAIDLLAQTWRIPCQENKRFNAIAGEGVLSRGNHKLKLLKPLTYMNRSGQSVRALLDWYKLEPESVLVIYDDMDLPVGRMRIRGNGSAGGHNGIKSIIAHLGTQNFPRLRLGIGKSGPQKDTVNHVLGKFAPDEKPIMEEMLYLCRDAIECMLSEGLEKAMTVYNGVNKVSN
jgi:PTH1 family peptidyl-tRNA hydrolase